MLKAMYTSLMLTAVLHRNIPGSEHAGVGTRADKRHEFSSLLNNVMEGGVLFTGISVKLIRDQHSFLNTSALKVLVGKCIGQQICPNIYQMVKKKEEKL